MFFPFAGHLQLQMMHPYEADIQNGGYYFKDKLPDILCED